MSTSSEQNDIEMGEKIVTYGLAWMIGTGVMLLLFAVVAFGDKVLLFG